MKILHVTHRYPPQTGGVERHVAALATRQRNAGHEVRVISADRRGARDSTGRDDSLPVERCRSFTPDDAYYFSPGVYLRDRR
jgi:glycosyltransferase involved in cell wall biosynthesis